MEILYFLLGFTATSFGAMAGLGGGVIIKPVLDAFAQDNVFTISVLSSATVFSMAIVSIIRQTIYGFKIRRTAVFLVIGASGGGIAGKYLFGLMASGSGENDLKLFQALVLTALLIIALLRKKLPDWEIENPIISAIIGFMLGAIAAFLGIGGGPINVAVICMFLAVDIKEAAVVSILIILFSQGAKLLTIGVTTGFSIYTDLYKLFYMIPGGIAGGFLGSELNRKLDKRVIHGIYDIIVAIIIALNIYNIARAVLI